MAEIAHGDRGFSQFLLIVNKKIKKDEGAVYYGVDSDRLSD